MRWCEYCSGAFIFAQLNRTELKKQSKMKINWHSQNPAYGRQRISRPIWIAAPIPKKSCSVRQNLPKNKLFFCAAILHSSLVKVFKYETTSFHYFSQGLQISKKNGHTTLGSGAKKMFKWYLKSEPTDTRTDGRTDTRTDISTYRKNCPRGPILWKSGVVATLRPKIPHTGDT